MLDAVYVDTVEEKRIVAIRPRPAFRPLFEVATTREDSGVVLVSERDLRPHAPLRRRPSGSITQSFWYGPFYAPLLLPSNVSPFWSAKCKNRNGYRYDPKARRRPRPHLPCPNARPCSMEGRLSAWRP